MKKISAITFRHINPKIDPKEGSFLALLGGFVPSDISDSLFWTKAEILPRNKWNQEGYQLNNEIRISGLPTGEIPNFSGADVDTEQISLGTAITLDFTTGFRLDFKILTNSYDQNAIIGKATQDGFYFASNFSIIIYGNAGGELVNFTFTALNTNQLYLMSLRCNGTTLSIFADGALIGSQSRGALTTSEIENISRARAREGRGIIYDVKINDVDNSDSFTHDYSGINGDWSDQIGTNDGAAGAALTYRKLSSLTPEGLIDLLNNTIKNPYKTGRINCLGGLHSGSTAINVGNTKTIAFGIYVAD
ncbi:MAG: hypothetical protein ACJASR_000581, partial [Psychroserpens sp.]